MGSPPLPSHRPGAPPAPLTGGDRSRPGQLAEPVATLQSPWGGGAHLSRGRPAFAYPVPAGSCRVVGLPPPSEGTPRLRTDCQRARRAAPSSRGAASAPAAGAAWGRPPGLRRGVGTSHIANPPLEAVPAEASPQTPGRSRGNRSSGRWLFPPLSRSPAGEEAAAVAVPIRPGTPPCPWQQILLRCGGDRLLGDGDTAHASVAAALPGRGWSRHRGNCCRYSRKRCCFRRCQRSTQKASDSVFLLFLTGDQASAWSGVTPSAALSDLRSRVSAGILIELPQSCFRSKLGSFLSNFDSCFENNRNPRFGVLF